MASLLSILGGLLVLMLGICGGICAKDNCDRAARERTTQREHAEEEAFAARLAPLLQTALPPEVGGWRREYRPEERKGLRWQIVYRDASYAAEVDYQNSPEGEAEYQRWGTKLRADRDAAKASHDALVAANAPQPARFEASESLDYFLALERQGRGAWSSRRLASHQILVRCLVLRQGVSSGAWEEFGIPGIDLALPRFGFVHEDRMTLPDHRRARSWHWPEVAQYTYRHRALAGGWEHSHGPNWIPMPKAPTPHAVELTVWAMDSAALDAFQSALKASDFEALSKAR